jgi:hypothetical protein
MIDAGHNWVRSLVSGTQFHHNVLVHTGDPYGTGIGAGVWLYGKSKDVAIYNNTFDAGAPIARDFDAPILSVSTGCSLSTVRNNVFTGVRKIQWSWQTTPSWPAAAKKKTNSRAWRMRTTTASSIPRPRRQPLTTPASTSRRPPARTTKTPIRCSPRAG